MGSCYTRLRGTHDATSGLPTYVTLTAPEVDRQYLKEKKRVEIGSAPGSLGPNFAPFDPSGGSSMLKSMKLEIPRQRLDDRQTLLTQLDQLKRSVDANGNILAMDEYHQRAVDLVLRGAGDAFDLSRESPKTVEP